jgi:hypothetical protein
MAKKEFTTGTTVKLISNTGQVINNKYTIIKVLDKHSLKVIDGDGVTLNVHKSRVKVIPDDHPQVERGKESKMPEEKKKEKKAKKTVKKELVAFDPGAWAKENGQVHLVKENKFDHPNHKCHTHMAIDEQAGYYFTINVYTYPDGMQSLGKKPKEAAKYPLKGKQVTKTILVKKTGQQEKRVNKGKETAEERLNRAVKQGYTVVSGKLVGKPKKEKKETKEVKEEAAPVNA